MSVSQGLHRAALACAIASTVVLIVAGLVPSAGRAFVSEMHWIAHFVSFAILAFAWKRALPQVSAWTVALATIAFGFAHEAIEVVGHAHDYELEDAIVDAAGAIAGVLLARLRARRPPR